MKTTVRDIMTTRVISAHTSTPFKEMAVRLRKDRVSAFPVLDDEGKVVGIVSESDMLPKETLDPRNTISTPGMDAEILRLRDRQKAESITAADLMTRPAVTASPEDSVDHAARLMYLRGVKRLPVALWPGSSAAPTCCLCSTARTRRSAGKSPTTSCWSTSGPTRAGSR
jgi:CBS-domain-containing membrane protein